MKGTEERWLNFHEDDHHIHEIDPHEHDHHGDEDSVNFQEGLQELQAAT